MPSAIATFRTSTFFKTIKYFAAAAALVLVLTLALGFHTSVSHGPRASQRIALTLDDGPNPPYTEKFLELLKREKVPATFFFIGRNIQMHRATALKVAAAGHEIANHSYSHRALAWAPPWLVADEIEKTDALIRELGVTQAIALRAPFGQWFGIHTGYLAWLGRTQTLYDVAPTPPDYFRSPPEEIAQSMIQRAQGGSILLLHDGEGIRIEALEAAARVIPELKKRGFTFVKLSEVLEKADPL